MRLTALLLARGALLLPLGCGDGGGTSSRTLPSLCRDYCAALDGAACPKSGCESVCAEDLGACPAACFDALAAAMDCGAATCRAEDACVAEMEALAACSPECL
ncbi:MAG TPA: hypothetical protein VGQ83_35505 [Polyangia bacterium]|jgi:hypothetical protein